MQRIGFVVELFYPDSFADAIRITPFVDKLKSEVGKEVFVHACTRTKDYDDYNNKINFIPAPHKSGKVRRLINGLMLACEIFLRIS
jgi:hypothetical protein